MYNRTTTFLLDFRHFSVKSIPNIILCESIFSLFLVLYMYTSIFWIRDGPLMSNSFTDDDRRNYHFWNKNIFILHVLVRIRMQAVSLLSILIFFQSKDNSIHCMRQLQPLYSMNMLLFLLNVLFFLAGEKCGQ